MCGRYTLRQRTEQIVQRFDVARVIEETFAETAAEPRFNIAPTQPVDVVIENGVRTLEMMRWGLVPAWAKDPSIGGKLLNARAETLLEKPSFRTALARRRCLIPADGFYEWQRQGKSRQAMHIHLPGDALFAFAGLYDEWTSPDGSPLRTCTVITVAPNALMAPIHDRMPAILRPENEAAWLIGGDAASLLALLGPYPDGWLDAMPVSGLVNSVANDSPACLAPYSPARPEQPALDL